MGILDYTVKKRYVKICVPTTVNATKMEIAYVMRVIRVMTVPNVNVLPIAIMVSVIPQPIYVNVNKDGRGSLAMSVRVKMTVMEMGNVLKENVTVSLNLQVKIVKW